MRRADRLLTSIATAFGVVPLALGLLRGATGRSFFYYTAPDAFYYLTVARNIASSGRSTFDGERLTNGYHPVWQAITALLALVTRVTGAGDLGLVELTVLLGVVLVGVAIALLCEAIRLDQGRLTPVVLLIPVGAVSFVQVPIMRHFFGSVGRPATTPWGAANGMETSLVLAAYGLCALAYVRLPRNPRGGLWFGLCCALLALARLDHAAFAVCLCAGLFVFEPASRRFAAVASAILAASLCAYLAANRAWFGMALPVSGALKSTFPESTARNMKLLLGFLHDPSKVPPTHAHRLLQLVLPAGAAFLTLATLVIRKLLSWVDLLEPRTTTKLDGFLLASAAGAMGLFLYDFVYVPPMNQGYWYFPVSNLLASLVVVAGTNRRSGRYWTDTPALAAALSLALASALVLQAFLVVFNPKIDSTAGRFFFDEAPGVRAFYAGKNARMMEFDDGVITFSTGIPAMSGMGLALDADAANAVGGLGENRHDSHLFQLGVARGYDRFTTWSYPHDWVWEKSSSLDIRLAFLDYIGLDVFGCRLRVEYSSRKTDFVIAFADCKQPP